MTVKQAIANGINRVVENHGDETFIACGYAAHDALITCISEELLRHEDARLIAAAPDLLEALKELLWEVRDSSAAKTVALQVIAKAEGRMKAEIERRASYTEAVLDLFLSRPFAWIDVRELADVGGFAGWRTRVSQARQIVNDRRSGAIEWNGQIKASAYRYVPAPPEPVAPRPAVQESLFGY